MEHKMQAGVYIIKNIVSGKEYIGSAKTIKRRIAQHKTALRAGKHQNKHLQASWDRNGEQTFLFSTLLVCAPEHVRMYEQRCIDTFNPRYNQSKSAYSGIPIGATCTEQHKQKVGIASAKMWKHPEYRDKVVAAIQAAMSTEECVARAGRAKALWENPLYREKAIAARKGKAYNKGYKCTPTQIYNRKKAARISNMKRNYGVDWKIEYIKRYPEFAGDIHGK